MAPSNLLPMLINMIYLFPGCYYLLTLFVDDILFVFIVIIDISFRTQY